jgi:hypothetical protein
MTSEIREERIEVADLTRITVTDIMAATSRRAEVTTSLITSRREMTTNLDIRREAPTRDTKISLIGSGKIEGSIEMIPVKDKSHKEAKREDTILRNTTRKTMDQTTSRSRQAQA